MAIRETELRDTIIRAPFDGVAISKDAQPGEMVSPVSAGGGFTRTGISTIVDMDSLEIEVDVNESYIGFNTEVLIDRRGRLGGAPARVRYRDRSRRVPEYPASKLWLAHSDP